MRPQWTIWLFACRPRTLPAAAAPVAMGSAVAAHAGALRPAAAFAALAGALLLQVGTNFANDVFDAEKGADTPERLGPVRAVAAGLVSAGAMRRAAWLVFAVAAAVGLYLVALGGWPIALLGVASIAAGILYTGGPWPLGYHGLGDALVFLFFGVAAVAGTVWVQMRVVPPLTWLVAPPVGFFATAILVVNNLRDREADARAGKRTLAVRFGPAFARREFAVLALAPFLFTPVIAAAVRSLLPLAALAVLPGAVSLVRAVLQRDGRALNPVLGATARVLLTWSVLTAGGIALSK